MDSSGGSATNIGSRIGERGSALSVTTAEDALDAAAIDFQVGISRDGVLKRVHKRLASHIGGISTAVDILNGVVAGMDIHGGTLVVHWHIGGQIAATIDRLEGILL